MGQVRGLIVSERTIGDYCVIDVSGEANGPVELNVLNECYQRNISGKKNLALNLTKYEAVMSSHLIGIIAGMYKTQTDKGGKFVLIPPSDPENASSLELVGMTQVLKIVPDETYLEGKINQ
jgi:hypothetical protein